MKQYAIVLLILLIGGFIGCTPKQTLTSVNHEALDVEASIACEDLCIDIKKSYDWSVQAVNSTSYACYCVNKNMEILETVYS